MMPLPERPEGLIWIFGLLTVADETGEEKLVGHYSRRKGLTDELEHGLTLFNDAKKIFEPLEVFPLDDRWRRPTGNPVRYEENGTAYFLFGAPTTAVRVRAELKSLRRPDQYESFTCVDDASYRTAKSIRENDKKESAYRPSLNADGSPRWRWSRELPPTTSTIEHRWIVAGELKPEHARFRPVDRDDPKQGVVFHSGSVRWNKRRNRWIALAGQIDGKASFLGEVWYAEAAQPIGPFKRAIHIATHERRTFYNVCHHDFLDRDDGRTIYFEGTYTREFSGNPEKTPRYDYNQLLYRLDLDDKRIGRVDD
jgi:hypothetical protein